jgi:phosphomannomutase
MTPERAIAAARAWIAADPDEGTRRELEALVADPRRHALLAEVMAGTLEFGTAGLRAVVGPGPMRMNRAVIRRTTAGVARYLARLHAGGPCPLVVLGADARLSSAAFASEALGVLAAHGLQARYFPAPVPTPIAAYVARRLEASAAIVITASHNPPEYNGYKLYAGDAVQIVPPVDAEIASEIARSAPATDEPTLGESALAQPGVQPVPSDLIEDYFRDVADLRPPGAPARDLSIVYTPLHGVGARAVERVLGEAGFRNLHVVAEQREPDGSFPTVAFPNPEEPGALDLATELARRVGADLVLANDPDVDRLAASVPDESGRWVPLTGNQIGVLLADFLLARAPRAPRPLVVQSIVSSPMLAAIAAEHDATLERTLTGFKWMWTAALELTRAGSHRIVFGYEEALGYSVGSLVRDKDGISAALLLAELAALERARGRSLRARLADLYRHHGLWVSHPHNVTRLGAQGALEIHTAMERLSARPPSDLGGVPVSAVNDYSKNAEKRPRWLGSTSLIELVLGDRGRVLVRPSGTEPKLKIYVDGCRQLAERADVWASERELLGEARALANATLRALELH